VRIANDSYTAARSSFTNPEANDSGIDGVKYDEKADKRSWALIQAFLDEIFAE